MKKSFKVLSVLLALIFIFAQFSVIYGEEADETEETEQDNITAVDRVAGIELSGNRVKTTNCSVSTTRLGIQYVDGRTAYVREESTAFSFLNINLKDDYWYSEEPQRVKITVEYKDMPNASFSVHYNSPTNGNWAYKDPVQCYGTNEWKIYEVYIDDFAPSKGLEYASTSDICIISKGWNMSGNQPVVLGDVLIEENVTEHAVEVSAENGYTGRIFDYGSSDEMTLKFENMLKSEAKASAEYEIYNNEGRKLYEGSIPEFFVDKRVSEEKVINTGVSECGTYTLKLETVSIVDDIEEVYERDFEFSVVRTQKPGDKDFEMAGVVGHFTRSTSGMQEGIKIIDRIGVSSVREEINWNDYERVPGVYKRSDIQKENSEALREADIKDMILMINANENYNGHTGDKTFLDDENEIKAFGEAAKQAVLNEADEKTEYIEILNEWNIRSFNPNGLGQDVYIKYLKSAYEAIKSVNSDIKVVGGTYAGYDVGSIRTFLQLGGLAYCDALSYHPYQTQSISLERAKSETETTRQMMLEYAGEIKPIVLSEFGWSTAKDHPQSMIEENRRKAFPMYNIYAYANEYIEKIYLYDLACDGNSETEREHNFGLLKFNSGHNALVATDTFVTYAAMNNLIQDAKPQSKIEKDGIYAYQFSQRDGKKLASLWTTNKSDSIALDLGVNEILMYDMYGNLLDTIKSDNGVFTFDLSDEIVYIQGDFKSFEEVTPIIYQESAAMVALSNDAFSFILHNESKKDLKVRLDYDEQIFTLNNIDYLPSGKIAVNMNVADVPVSTKHIKVTLYDEAGVYYIGKAKIDITDERIKIDFVCQQESEENDKRWIVAVNFKNVSQYLPVSGKCYISQPTEYAQEIRKFTNLAPGTERQINLNMPEMLVKRPVELAVAVELDNGERFENVTKLDFTTALYTEEKPVIDGVKSETELWNETALLAEDREEKFTAYSGGAWRGKQDCSMVYRMLWDEDNLYLFIIEKDDIFAQNEIPSNMWNGDSIQFGILEKTSGIEAQTFTEICIALTKSGPQIYRHSSNGGKAVSEVSNFEGAILRNNGETVYEIAIPWSELFNDDFKPEIGKTYGFSLLVNDNDGDSVRHGWLNYNDGIGSVKDSLLFGNLTLLK